MLTMNLFAPRIPRDAGRWRLLPPSDRGRFSRDVLRTGVFSNSFKRLTSSAFRFQLPPPTSAFVSVCHPVPMLKLFTPSRGGATRSVFFVSPMKSPVVSSSNSRLVCSFFHTLSSSPPFFTFSSAFSVTDHPTRRATACQSRETDASHQCCPTAPFFELPKSRRCVFSVVSFRTFPCVHAEDVVFPFLAPFRGVLPQAPAPSSSRNLCGRVFGTAEAGGCGVRTPQAAACSRRAFSTASSRRTTDKFWLRRHVGLVVVPHQTAYVVERLGKYLRTLDSGLHFLWPIFDKVAYAHSLKEEPIVIPNQTAITKDNVTLQIDGVLYVKITSAYDASYGVTNPIYAVSQLAQTTMRSELGKLTLDNTFLERDTLNRNIVEAINQAAQPWGVTCLRYEIRDILLPPNIRAAMERQAEAERRKRADILHSEGERESAINLAKGKKESLVLHAEGEAAAVRLRAEAAAESVKKIAETTAVQGGMQALSLQLADNYISAFGHLAKSSNTLVVPANAGDAASMLTQALTIFKHVDGTLSAAAPKGPVSTSQQRVVA